MIFHHQSPGKILVLELCAQMLSANQIAEFCKIQYLKEEVNDEVYFSHADKHQSPLQVDTYHFGCVQPGIPEVPNIRSPEKHAV